MKLAPLIRDNFLWKLGSLILAVLAWSVIHSATDDDERAGTLLFGRSQLFEVPVTVRTAPSDTRGFILRPDKVQVEVRGPGDEVRNLQPAQVEATVNLVSLADAVRLTSRVTVHVPPGFRVLGLTPEEVTVERGPPAATR